MFLLHEGQYREAALRFQYSIKKVPSQEYEGDSEFEKIRKSLTLNLIRCKTKLNVRAFGLRPT